MTHDVPLKFTLATADDAAAIANLVQAAFRHQDVKWTGPDTALNAGFTMSAEQVLATIETPNAAFLMATASDGTLVGAMATIKKTDTLARLAMLAVDPALQAGGIGRRVLAYAEEYAVETWGVETLGLDALNTRELLIEWYERQGYVRTGERSEFPASSMEKLGLVKDLYFVEMEKKARRV